jgi:hypothetical protein
MCMSYASKFQVYYVIILFYFFFSIGLETWNAKDQKAVLYSSDVIIF